MSMRPVWANQTERQLMRLKHPILYGNVDDYFIWQNEGGTDYYTLYEGLNLLLSPYYPAVIATYDGTELGLYGDATARDFARTFLPILGPSGDGTDNYERYACDSMIALKGFQDLLVQKQKYVVCILPNADMLTSDAERYSEEERERINILRNGLCAAHIHEQGSNQGYKNTLILVAHDLKRVPVWLYQNNPHIALVQVTPPGREERRQYALHFMRPVGGRGGFQGAEQLSNVPLSANQPSPLEAVAEELADATDGMTLLDLVALRNSSYDNGMAIIEGKVWKLVDYYRFGTQNDPWQNLNARRVHEAEQILSRRVIGQKEAVSALTGMLMTAHMGLTLSRQRGRGKPKGVFFFVGPTGVGKTELAKALAELIFGDENACLRFDMSEYQQEHSAEKLIGAPPGFVGYADGGHLTNRMIENPYRILLFDEIEKAHPLILDKFLQILEDGRLTDGKGQTAFFHQSVIIFTSNIGAKKLMETADDKDTTDDIGFPGGDGDYSTYEELTNHFRKSVAEHFTEKIGRPELLNRLGDGVVVFDRLRPKHISAIGAKFLQSLREQATERFQIHLHFNCNIEIALRREMGKPDNLKWGGRRVRTLLETLVERPLNVWLFNHSAELPALRGATLEITLESDNRLEVNKVHIL